jgi:predicted porin
MSWMPVENVTLDAGLLWHKFGEPPISILNPNVTRPVSFLAQPVCFRGARVSFNAGIAKLYAGMNDGSALGAGHGAKAGNERAFEVGASANVAETLNVAVNYFDHDEGYNTINMSVGTEAGICSAKLEANYVTADTENAVGAEDSATTYALYASFKFSDCFKLPVRIELVDDNNSEIYGAANYDGWNIAITPTYNPTKNSFIRAEIVYALDDNEVFADDNGVAGQEDNRTSVIAEFGFLF